jgi:hypothetical protein
MQPRQKETGADVGLEEQPEVVEVVVPTRPGIPGRMGLEGGSRRGFGGGAGGGDASMWPRAANAGLCRLTSV